MDPDPKLEAQRSTSNVHAFRRLKWGDPPERFRLDRVLGGSHARGERLIDLLCLTAAIGAVGVLVWVVV